MSDEQELRKTFTGSTMNNFVSQSRTSGALMYKSGKSETTIDVLETAKANPRFLLKRPDGKQVLFPQMLAGAAYTMASQLDRLDDMGNLLFNTLNVATVKTQLEKYMTEADIKALLNDPKISTAFYHWNRNPQIFKFSAKSNQFHDMLMKVIPQTTSDKTQLEDIQRQTNAKVRKVMEEEYEEGRKDRTPLVPPTWLMGCASENNSLLLTYDDAAIISTLRDENDALRRKVDGLQNLGTTATTSNRIAELEKDRDELREKLVDATVLGGNAEAAKQTIERLNAYIANLEKTVNEPNPDDTNTITTLRADKAALEKDVADLREELGKAQVVSTNSEDAATIAKLKTEVLVVKEQFRSYLATPIDSRTTPTVEKYVSARMKSDEKKRKHEEVVEEEDEDVEPATKHSRVDTDDESDN
ncbi:hypothetical protein HK097_007241 [Rhizophlyctis rosea]|uniref:Uncharacterized protein n=1 Tax=Rhizophlyctis rosea TaxID=64517 RepID=A0AAD5X618_9FUNG|nr:hypothetical protein HK097_007241 [Rhizophlyctis rosea]